jgi:hypothetical protein
MQALEITTSPNVVCLTVERAALDSAMLTRITDALRTLENEPLLPQGQEPIKQPFVLGMGKGVVGNIPDDFDALLDDFEGYMA